MPISKVQKYSNILSIIFCTPLRAIVVLTTPFFATISHIFFHGKMNKKIIFLYILILVSSIVGLVNNTIDFANIILYIWICFPLIFLLFCDIDSKKAYIPWPILFKSFRRIVILIDIIGYISLFLIFRDIDEFGFGYGRHFEYTTGLCVLNMYLVLYYLAAILKGNYTKSNLKNLFFFFSSFIFCFSGLMLILFLLTYLVYILIIQHNFKIIAILLIACTTTFILLKKFSDGILEYNIYNIEMFLDEDKMQNNARFGAMCITSYQLISENSIVSLIGVGPGGYNSRTCFMLNEDADNILTTILGHHMPIYHQQLIYPLWNKSFVSKANHTDGTRNKPFSSMFAFWVEIGSLFFFLLCFFWIKRIFLLKKNAKQDEEYLYLFFLNIFCFLLLCFGYWFESSEFIFFLIINNSIISHKKYKEKYDTQDHSLLLAK